MKNNGLIKKIHKSLGPTAKRIDKIQKKCDALPCLKNIDRVWTCDKCKISTEYEEFVGIRLEEDARFN